MSPWVRSSSAVIVSVLHCVAESSVLPVVCADAAAAADGSCSEDAGALGLLQFDAFSKRPPRGQLSAREESIPELVLQHIPYNFGHTIEKVATFGNGQGALLAYGFVNAALARPMLTEERWEIVNSTKLPNAQVWGHMNPDLFATSEVTGCPLYFTPGKYWPKEIAEAYFGNKNIFGMLRDPYERLVAMFRGNFGAYGGSYPKYFKTCDVNGAVRQMMENYIKGDIYSGDCTFVPQAEFFDKPFGIELAVDNRLFPDSVNKVFEDHGYQHFHIYREDILHVVGCPDVWAGDLDCQTKALVKKVYARDFELLCNHFGYCDSEENTCIKNVPTMCPNDIPKKNETATHCHNS